MAQKFYAVRDGRVPGVYLTWEECKAQVDGYSGADYKGFSTREEAVQYVGGKTSSDLSKSEKKEINMPVSDCAAVVYTDGSFDVKTNRFALGAVLFYNNEQLFFSKAFENEELATMRNVAGEIMAAVCVMKHCINNQIPSVEIRYDYEGVEKWCTGAWKTNKSGTIEYKRFYDSIKDKLHVKFTKVKGHSGDEFNDMADGLAKKALGIGQN